ncbi:MAG: outer membrane beta-barrel protein, partial [Alphaproteobacteria bacterium]
HQDMNIVADVGYQQYVEERSSVDDANGIKPTEYDVISFNAAVTSRWNKASLSFGGRLHQFDYDDVSSSSATINNDDRDRDEIQWSLRGGYEFLPQYEAFIQLVRTVINYNDPVDDNGVDRDNDGFEIRLGTRIDVTGILYGDVFVGYISRDYDDSSLKQVEAVSAGMQLTWNVTRLTSVTAVIQRDISETTLASAGGNFSTSINASVDHELLRNLILFGRASFTKDEFEGTTREDESTRAGFGTKYLLNRYLHLIIDYQHAKRESTAVNSDYSKNIFSLKIRAQL